ncbi:MAG: NAD(P)/FAD-dependent oxidoreductase [Halioglobus sp.]
MSTKKTDYLVIGAGAMGMAFADVLMSESQATITIVDRYHQPGGHWNVAYPFVRLHQPSSFYGVNSRPLGNDRIDTIGWNKGLYELAGKGEICAYYDNIMHDFVSSGRVQYFPMCEYQHDGTIRSLVSDAVFNIDADTIVDATFMNVQVPAMAAPSYEVAQGVQCVAPNALVDVSGQWDNYVIVGAGKTSFDACLFLLDKGVNPDNICWIKPRESWLWDRARVQGKDLFETSIRPFSVGQLRTIAESESLQDLFDRASAEGLLLRIDEAVKPTMFRCATVSKSEIEQLRRINNVIRLGRVQRIEAGRVVLDQGSFDTGPNTLYVDCTADGLAKRPPQPVFAGNRVTLQAVRTCQQVFSAAFIAHIALTVQDEARKNLLCTPVPHPDTDIDYLHNMLADLVNGAAWQEDESLYAWIKSARLDGFSFSESGSPESDAQHMQSLAAYGAVAAEKLMGYLGELASSQPT